MSASAASAGIIALAAATAAVPAEAGGQASARITADATVSILHGVPGATVDVSLEPDDGLPELSRNSIIRGTLPA